MESPAGELSRTPLIDFKKAGYSELPFGAYAQTTVRTLSPALRCREITLSFTGDDSNTEAPSRGAINKPTPARRLSPAATPEKNKVQPLSRNLVPEPKLWVELCLCVLITTWDSNLSTRNGVILGVGVVWACLTAAVGAAAVLKESKVLVWIFMTQNFPQVAFFVFLIYMVVVKWHEDSSYTLEAAAITGGVISLLIKIVLVWSLVRLVRSFGQGLKERMFAGTK